MTITINVTIILVFKLSLTIPLNIINNDEADTLLKENEENAKERYEYYESLTTKNKE